ncbi:hypothetical protein IC766_15910 [Acinetobacter seifertii]|uniref:hypothetical protein n=1 Tax=Acinetobacter seifertii TaxID=1530123 RepID=UPI00168A9422|nr:hypothetical protein [Acinetobacter seifertii]QNY13555.1 hypothetical protein IC766_15910 [Acinetobacter seifertii]
MSRLQIGGLAMIISDFVCHENDGKVVKIIAYHDSAECRDPTGYYIAHAIWEVACESGIVIWDGSIKFDGGVGYEGKYLLPLGDEEGIKLYNLKEEQKEAF